MTLPGIYSQRDERWCYTELGWNDDGYYNIYHFGCLVTAIANMLWWNGNPQSNPGSINQWMKDNGGFEAGGGNLIWSAVQPLLDQVQMVSNGYSSDLEAVNNFLQDENAFAIAQLTRSDFPMHFSVMPYVGTIADSWDGVMKSVNNYEFVGAHLYTKIVQTAPAPIVPPVEPVPAPVQLPVPLPNPDPIPTSPVTPEVPVSPLPPTNPPVIDVTPPTKPEEPTVPEVTPPTVQPEPVQPSFFETTLGRTIISVGVSLIGVAVYHYKALVRPT